MALLVKISIIFMSKKMTEINEIRFKKSAEYKCNVLKIYVFILISIEKILPASVKSICRKMFINYCNITSNKNNENEEERENDF